MKWSPRSYQLAAAQFMLERDGAALMAAPGLGKTSISYAVAKTLLDIGESRGVLVVAPRRPMQETWPAEREKWDDFKLTRLQVLHGAKKAKALATPADVYVINPEGLEWLFSATNGKLPFDTLVVDESTKFKNPASQRFKLMRKELHRFSRRYILTGSPRPNRIADLWAQIYLLDGGERLGLYITHFRRKYMMDMAPRGAKYSDWQPVMGAVEDVQEKIRDIAMVLRAKDYIDMPELLTNDIHVKLPKPTMTAYRELRDYFITQLKSGVVTAGNAAAKTMKLRQMANGIIYGDDGSSELVHTEKLDALSDLIDEQSGEPILVAVSFLSEAEMLCKKFDAPYIGGGVGDKRMSELVRAWNAGELPVLIAHPASVAHGLNLQESGCAICWYGLTYNLEDYEQFIARLWRSGQKRGVVVHRIIADGTIDEAIVQTLASKDADQRAFLAALRSML